MSTTKSSTVPVIAWNWVIQALSKFKQVDASILVGLVKKAPAISDDLGRDAREMLSLRILESLFIHGSDEATVYTDSSENVKISFDPSEHCEDVLHKILEETSEPVTKLEREKWNVCPFIMHKRSSLPKSPFQKFKEALLDGSHPLLSTLIERSKIGTANVSENTRYVADVSFDAQTTVAEEELASSNPANENNKLQESPLQKSNELDNLNRVVTEHVGRKEHETSIESPVKGLEENTLMDQVEHIVSKKVEQSCGPSGEGKSSMENGSQLETDEGKNTMENGGQLETDKGKNTMENGSQIETDSDCQRSDDERTDSESDDERTDIAAKKEAFLSSQCTLSQDSMAMNDICLCMKCNKGGQLLVCSSNACLFRVHESCMGSAATLDENGKFYCPFCAYSRAISKYLLVKKKTSLARKDLQAFLRSGVKHRQKISSKKGAGPETKESRYIGTPGENFVDIVSRGKEDCPPIKPSSGEERAYVSDSEDSVVAEPSRLRVNKELPYGDNGVSVGGEVEKNVGKTFEEESLVGIGEHAAIRLNSGCVNTTTDSLHQPLRQPRMPKAQSNGKESPASDVSNHPRRSCKRKSQYTSPVIPLLGRKKLQWTKSEEEILKEGVQRFCNGDNKRIPWREILSFGEGVFHKGRTAIDLKDKWRNICKGSPAGKKPKL